LHAVIVMQKGIVLRCKKMQYMYCFWVVLGRRRAAECWFLVYLLITRNYR
jgi:hypothetical protein